jgi:hypothetical protein
MPDPVIPDMWRVALHWAGVAGTYAINVMHFLDGTGSRSATDVATTIDGNVTANMWALVSDGTAVDILSVRPLDGLSPATDWATGEPAKWTGATSGNPIPNVASIVKFRTGFAGRRHRGRVFLPFVSEGAVNAGQLDSTKVGSAQTAWNNFLAAQVVDDLPLYVVSAASGTGDSVTSLVVEQTAATQRRRQSRLR